MHISVKHPKRTYYIYKGNRGLPFRIKHIYKTVNPRAEAYRKIDYARQHKTEGHQHAPVIAVSDEPVDKTGYAIHDSVQRQENAELHLCYAESLLHGRNRRTEILAEEIIENVAYYKGHKSPPLPIIVLFLSCRIHNI